MRRQPAHTEKEKSDHVVQKLLHARKVHARDSKGAKDSRNEHKGGMGEKWLALKSLLQQPLSKKVRPSS